MSDKGDAGRRLIDRIFAVLLPLFCIAILGVLAAYGFGHDRIELRTLTWGQQASCPTQLLTTNPGVPQTLLLGTSRTMQGISADALAEALGQAEGSVINLGTNGRATDLQYLIAEELAHQGRLDRIIIELSVGSPASDRFLAQSRAAGEEIGTGASLIQSEAAMLFASRRQVAEASDTLPLLARVHERMQIALRRLSAVGRYGVRAAARSVGLISTPPPSNDRAERSGCRQQSVYQLPLVSPPADQLDRSVDYFTRPATQVDRTNYQRLIALGQRHGVSVLFIRMPDRFSPVDDARLAIATRQALGSAIAIPPAALVNQLRRQHFVDPTHVDHAGAIVIARWLAQDIQARDAGRDRR